jgi:chemotaxis family two-component system response regulator Rcp1
MSELKRPIDILLIEDNPGDVRLTREMLKECSVPNRLTSVSDGIEAISYLRRQGKYKDVSRPDLILLDLNLPRMDGREVLAELKGDSELKCIPVVVLTSSQAESDVLATYKLHANCYVTKPVGLSQFGSVVHSIEQFWLATARLPSDIPT